MGSVQMPFGGVLRAGDSGRWFYDHYQGSKRIKKSTKTRDLNVAKLVAARIAKVSSAPVESFGSAYESDYYDVYKTAKKNAQKSGKAFDLTLDDMHALMQRCDGHCEVSGLKFRRVKLSTKYERQPFMPSLDRINSEGGYTIENCRIVCVAANYAMNTWGSWVLYELSNAAVKFSRVSGG